MTNDIFVFDDIVPGWLYNSIKKNISSIPVTCQHHGEGPDQGNRFFSKIWPLYGLHDIPWEYNATFAALNDSRARLSTDDEVVPLHLVQCQLNLTTKSLVGEVHADRGPPAWTMVHLIAGDTGMDFWEGDANPNFSRREGKKIHEVEWKDNRCIIFPSNLLHRGLPPNNIEPRLTLGYIFGGTPQSQQEHNANVISPIFRKEYNKKMARGRLVK